MMIIFIKFQISDREKNTLAWKSKTEQAKKGETLRELQKLNVQIAALEREKATHLYSRRSDFRGDFSQLEEIDSKSNDEKKTEKIKLKQQLEKISHMVKRFHMELRDIKPTPEFVEKLKITMEEIEGTINAFKEQQRKQYEELMREEKTTAQEIQALERKFESWNQLSEPVVSKKPQQKPLASARDITKDLPQEVAQFEKFLEETGGVRGGWDEYDHQTFLKFRQRHNGKEIFIQHSLVAIPTRTEEEIRDHEDWYQSYLSLNEKKKESIKKWRKKKEEDKDDVISKVDQQLEDEEAKKEEKKKKKEEIIQTEKRERYKQLNSYRVQKELERAQAEERKLREELEKARKKEEERKRQIEARERDEVWERAQKDQQKEIAARELVKFRERDKKTVLQRLANQKAKEEEQKEKEKRLEKLKGQVEIEVSRDPNRLLQPTAGWTSRTKDKGSSGTGPLLHIPHRAVPSWRQGP
ncbi:Coiled-coil domain-containing protein 112 [Mytilus edulis]|uniref:Coiled-coil domain-containing protein 112 n=1 Tax=Mytilus edulis TaxID=6550 RepID=A0A8S3Q865_MYTED|nr:Coiled-coil domain-containing protein 112 [Mytilus edulis]